MYYSHANKLVKQPVRSSWRIFIPVIAFLSVFLVFFGTTKLKLDQLSELKKNIDSTNYLVRSIMIRQLENQQEIYLYKKQIEIQNIPLVQYRQEKLLAYEGTFKGRDASYVNWTNSTLAYALLIELQINTNLNRIDSSSILEVINMTTDGNVMPPIYHKYHLKSSSVDNGVFKITYDNPDIIGFSGKINDGKIQGELQWNRKEAAKGGTYIKKLYVFKIKMKQKIT